MFGSEYNTGYMVIQYKGKKYLVHRLVGETFIENPEKKPQIDHINRVRNDNRVENLRWADYSLQNKNRAKFSIPKNNAHSKIVLQYTKTGNFVKEWPSTKEAERQLGFYQSNISECCRGKRKTAHGYIWKFKNPQPAQFLEDEVPVSAFYEYDCDNNHFDLFQYSNLLYDKDEDIFYDAN